MLVLIEKDSATRIPKECTQEQAEKFAADFPVFVVNDDASTTPWKDWKESFEKDFLELRNEISESMVASVTTGAAQNQTPVEQSETTNLDDSTADKA